MGSRTLHTEHLCKCGTGDTGAGLEVVSLDGYKLRDSCAIATPVVGNQRKWGVPFERPYHGDVYYFTFHMKVDHHFSLIIQSGFNLSPFFYLK